MGGYVDDGPDLWAWCIASSILSWAVGFGLMVTGHHGWPTVLFVVAVVGAAFAGLVRAGVDNAVETVDK